MPTITGSAFAISFGYYSIAAVVLFTVFGLLRCRKSFQRLYAPKLWLPACVVEGWTRPPKLPKAFLTWVAPVLSYDQRQVLAYSGYDGLTMMRVLYFGLAWSLVACFFCLGAILPVNLVGDNVDELRKGENGDNFGVIDEFTMANISERDTIIVVHVVVVYILSLVTYHMLWKWHKEAVGLRISYLAGRPKGAESYTVLMTDIPGTLDGTVLQRALFAVPQKKRAELTQKLTSSASQVTSGGAGCLGKANNVLFDCCVGTCSKMHRGDEQHPVTHYASDGQPTYASPMAAPADVVPISSKAGPASEQGRVVDYVSGIPLEAELSAWPKANRMIGSGMTMEQMVEAECREVFGDDFIESQLVFNTSEVNGPYKEYNSRYEKMLDQFDGWYSKAHHGKLVKKNKPVEQPKTAVVPMKMGKWGTDTYGQKPCKVPVLDFNIARMEQLKKTILEKQAEAKTKPASSAFVTLKNRVKQTLAATALVHHDTSSWLTREAPAPEEVVWSNLRWRGWERALREVAMVALYITLVLLFMIPVTALQGMISSVSWLDFLKVGPLNAIYTAVVPTIALKLFIAMLPFILRKMSYMQGMNSIVDIELGLEYKYYGFQYVVLFLTPLLGGALVNQLQDFIDDPSKIVSILGTSVPGQALFFTNYVMLETLVITPFRLSNIVGVILYKIKTKLAGSERAKARVWQDQWVSYGKDVGNTMMLFMLIMVFSPVFPIMAPFGVLYFVTGIITWKYNLCYVWRPECESGGKLWPLAYRQIIINLFTMQLLMTFIIALKKNIAAAIALIPIMVFTPLFGYLANKQCKRPLAVMSLRAAADCDVKDTAQTGAAKDVEDASTGSSQYVNPVLEFDEARHQAFLAEATKWQATFAAGTYDPKDFPLEEEPEEVPGVAEEDPLVVRLKSVKRT